MESNKGENHKQPDAITNDIDDSVEAPKSVPLDTEKNFVEVPLTSDDSSAVVLANPPEVSEEVTEVPTLPVCKRQSIELQKVEINPKLVVSDSSVDEKPTKPPRQTISTYPRPEVIYAPERLSNLMGCFKCALVAITFALMVLGTAIIAVAAWLKADPEFLSIRTGLDLTQFSSSTNIAIAIGIAIFIIGIIGFCGAVREIACLLMVYFVIALILVILETVVIGVIWSATNNPQTKEKVSEVLKKAIEEIEKSKVPMIDIMDIVQKKFECCGVDGIADYKDKILPRSCYSDTTGLPYYEGCLDKLLNYLKSKAALIGGVSVAILVLQVGGLALAMLLYCALRQGTSKVY